MFENTFEIIERGLAERDKLGIGLKWPLDRAVVKVIKGIKLSRKIIEIIERQLNVKKIELKDGSEFSVLFDTKITPELEAEG